MRFLSCASDLGAASTGWLRLSYPTWRARPEAVSSLRCASQQILLPMVEMGHQLPRRPWDQRGS